MVLAAANTTIEEAAGGIPIGENLATFFIPVPLNGDLEPTLFASDTLLEQDHGWSQGVDYVSAYIQQVKKSALVVPMPIATEGIVGQLNMSGNSGTSVVSIKTSTGGSLDRTQGRTWILKGGTVGVDQIRLQISLDGGRTRQQVRLGTATSYVIPRVGLELEFAAGTLIDGDMVLSWVSTPPEIDDADLDTAREKLAEQRRQSRTWFLVKEMSTPADALAWQAAASEYDTGDKRHVQALCYQRPNYTDGAFRTDGPTRWRGRMAQTYTRMIGSPSIDFTQGAGPPNDTIVRDAGSFVDDGFDGWDTVADWITVTGASEAGNNDTWQLESAVALTLTLEVAGALTTDTDAEGVRITAAPGLLFIDGGGAHELKRGKGSWLDDGFEAGDTMTISGTLSNDGDYPIVSLTDSTITVATGSFVAEEISSWGVTIYTYASYNSDFQAQDAAFATLTGDYHPELAYGYATWRSSLTGWVMRRPAALADLCRGFQVDLSETTWHNNDGPLGIPGGPKWGFLDGDGRPFEYDDRKYDLASDAGFTAARTFAEDSSGLPYISTSVTRNGSGGVLDQSHYARVGNTARTVVQAVTIKFTGGTFDTRTTSEGKFLTGDARNELKARVDQALANALLGVTRRGEGPRVEKAAWTPSADDNLDPAAGTPTLTGVCELTVRGTIFRVNTVVRIS
jgi:hypothetical protein